MDAGSTAPAPLKANTLVLGGPTVAARVIATANSSPFGLQHRKSAASGQATTFLGLLGVRQMCSAHAGRLLQPRDAAQRREFDRLWHAKATSLPSCASNSPP